MLFGILVSSVTMGTSIFPTPLEIQNMTLFKFKKEKRLPWQLGNWLLNTLTSWVSFLPDWSIFFPLDYWRRRMRQKTRNWPPKASVGKTISFLESSFPACCASLTKRATLDSSVTSSNSIGHKNNKNEWLDWANCLSARHSQSNRGNPIFSDLQSELFRAARFPTAVQEEQRLWYEAKEWIEVYFSCCLLYLLNCLFSWFLL